MGFDPPAAHLDCCSGGIGSAADGRSQGARRSFATAPSTDSTDGPATASLSRRAPSSRRTTSAADGPAGVTSMRPNAWAYWR